MGLGLLVRVTGRYECVGSYSGVHAKRKALIEAALRYLNDWLSKKKTDDKLEATPELARPEKKRAKPASSRKAKSRAAQKKRKTRSQTKQMEAEEEAKRKAKRKARMKKKRKTLWMMTRLETCSRKSGTQLRLPSNTSIRGCLPEKHFGRIACSCKR